MQNFKKIISLILSFIIAFSVFLTPTNVKAESMVEETDQLEPEEWYEIDNYFGNGTGIYWGIIDGTLIIKGDGAIPDFSEPQPYSSYDTVPWWDEEITKVIIREGITAIGKNAFNAKSYTEEHIPLYCSCDCHSYGNLEYDCDNNCSFDSCYDYWVQTYESRMNITEVVLPNSLKSIAQGAFYECDAVETMTLPFIGGSPAETVWDYEQSFLGYIFMPLGNYDSYDDNNNYIPSSLKTIIVTDACEVIPYYALNGVKSIENITLPDKTIEISSNAFLDTEWYNNQPSGLIYINKVLYGYKDTCPEKVVVKDGTLSIAAACFSETKLKSIAIPDSVKIVGTSAFWDCKNLTNVSFGNGINTIVSYMFYGCTSLKNIEIPESVTTIGESAFYSCTSLTNITIPDSVTTIGNSAFYSCTSLTNITIPDSVTTIDNSAFHSCTSLTNITIPDSVTTIGESAFHSCTSLTNITIPDSVTTIGYSAFSSCTSLTNITIPDSVTTIGSCAFQDCTALSEISMPQSIISVGYDAFKNTALYNNQTENLIYVSDILCGYRDTCPETIEIKTGTRVIASSAFFNCKNIKTVVIPNTVEIICGSAFRSCNGITTISIPNSVTSIGNSAFEYCSNLTSITIPDSVTSIGYDAFYGCSALAGVYITDLTAWCNIDFADYYSNPLFRAKKLYLNNALITELNIPENIKTIKKYAFNNCTDILSVSIPDSILSIECAAFAGCTSIQNIRLPFIGSGDETATHLGYIFGASEYNSSYTKIPIKTIEISDKCETIGDHAFYNFANLTSITIPDSITSIGASAFYNCASLTSITIPDSVTTIGDYTFYNCSSLTSITIPDSVSSVEAGTFCNCSSLTSITIPDSITSIGASAFYNCKNLTEILLGEKVQDIGYNAFYYCSALKSISISSLSSWLKISFNNNYANPTCYNGSLYVNGEILSGNLVIPDDVTTIGSYTFYNNTNITEVTFESTVTSVGSYAFSGCTNITKVNSKSLTDWCGINFVNATANPVYYGKLFINGSEISKNLNIPNGVEKLGAYTFLKQSQITTITIPDSVESIGFGAFYDCTSVQKITLPFVGSGGDSSHLGYIFGATDYYYNDDYVPVTLTDVVISNKCESIGNSAFYYCSNLTSITIPDSVTTIGDYAFKYCSSLTGITIGKNVTSIGYDAFEYCSNLTSITIPDSVTTIGAYAFEYCSNLTSITIGKNVTSIGYNAFYGCSALTGVYITDLSAWCNIAFDYSEANPLYYAKKLYLNNNLVTKINIPNGVKEIHSYAFYNCYDVTSITISDSVTTIGDYAFYYCSNLASITIPDSITSIGASAFRNCASLTSITIPDSVTSIGSGAFYGCSAIETITLPFIGGGTASGAYFGHIFGVWGYSSNLEYVPSSLKKVIISGNCETIYDNAFKYCANIEEIVLPESLKTIKDSAFYGCTSLSKITIPNEVTTIGSSAFYGCTSLSKITIPSKVTTIGYSAFYGCTSLSKITIPSKVTTIGSSAFYGCTSISEISLPNSIESIGTKAFHNTLWYNNLSNGLIYINNVLYGYKTTYPSTLNVKEGTVVIANGAFENCTSITTVSIPSSITVIPASAFNNCSYISSVTLNEGLKKIDNYAFYYCRNLKNITIPDGVTSIGDLAFYYCTALTEISLPDSVTSIGSYAFCDAVFKKINIPKGITTIKSSTFYDCDNLTDVVIPSGVETIGDYAFDSCDNLTNITLPTSVTKIGYLAFGSCYKLSAVYYTGTSEQWNKISIDTSNNYLLNATKYFDRCVCSGQLTWYDYTAPTCTIPGNYAHYKCSNCNTCFDENKNEITNVEIPISHNIGDWHNPTEPTCEDFGTLGHYECTNCDECFDENKNILSSIIVPAKGHSKNSFSILNSTTYPFALNDGVYSSTNKDNSSSSTFTITAVRDFTLELQYYTSTEKSYDKLTITKNFDILVTESGYSSTITWKSLSIDMKSGDQLYIKYGKDISVSNGKDTVYFKILTQMSNIDAFEPTCEEGVTCDVCGKTAKNPKGHNYGEWIAPVAHTCDTNGVLGHFECSDCGKYFDETKQEMTSIIDPAAHSLGSLVNKTHPTCTTEGTMAHYECSGCGKYFDSSFKQIDSITISALGHDRSVWITELFPTCTTKGYKYSSCTRCGDLQKEVLAATNHNISNGTCSICGVGTETIESDHNYKNNAEEEYLIFKEGATSLTIEFSADTETEDFFDTIEIFDSNNNSLGSFSGTELAFKTFTINGDNARIVLTSDSSVNAYGFKAEITATYAKCSHKNTEWITDAEPTLNAKGHKHKFCNDCNKNIGEADILKLSYGDVNNDGLFDLQDVTLFAQTLAGWNTTIYDATLDVDGDKVVNLNDLILLAQFVAGWDVELAK